MKTVKKIRNHYQQKDHFSKCMINILSAGVLSYIIIWVAPYSSSVIADMWYRLCGYLLGKDKVSAFVFYLFTSRALFVIFNMIAICYLISVIARNIPKLHHSDLDDYSGDDRDQ